MKQNQIPLESLPDGTVLETTAYFGPFLFPHPGIVQRTWNGVVISHNSKKLGRAVMTSFSEFTEGREARVKRFPQTWAEGALIAQRAAEDVRRGIPWTVTNTCEDFESRAVRGQNGSPTRNAIVGAGLVSLVLWLAFRN